MSSTMDTNGIFDTMAYDSSELKTVESKLKRRSYGETFYKEVTVSDIIYIVPFKQYHFSVPVNHGLCRTTDCLPADTTVSIRFRRAPSSFSVLKLEDTVVSKVKSDESEVNLPMSYNKSVIEIINPVLNVYYAYSTELEQTMSRIKSSSIEIGFMDYVARQTILDTGLSSYDINLLQGSLPRYVFFAISDLPRLNGQETTSLTRFVQGDLDSFNLVLDQESIPFHPLSGNGSASFEFYQNYLQQTNRYLNPWSAGVTSFKDFKRNFHVVANLEKMKITEVSCYKIKIP